jgi:glutamyl-tRNA reductase
MPILVCGINHKTAPVALREKVVFAQDKLALYLNDLVTQENIQEAVLLSTCNRSELYCSSDDVNKVTDWFCRQHSLSRDDIESVMYFYQDMEAVKHLMNVACGLDSMVLGESQILGQMKEAFSEGCAAGSVGPMFNRLFQQVFTVAKEVRTNTAIGACPVSVSSAAVNFIKQHFLNNLNQATLVLIGAGVSAELVLRHLKNDNLKKIMIANRSFENASKLAQKYTGEVISLTKLPKALAKADIVISATGGAQPVVTKSMLTLREKPLLIVDIAVPRDVEMNVAELENVSLYSIDDLKEIIQKNLQGREHAALKAREVIKQKSHEFMVWLNSLDMVAVTIRAYRKQIEDLCHAEMTKAMRQLKRGDDPMEVMSSFAQALTNKLLHTPSVQLRQAGYEGRLEILQLAQQLFAIPEPKSQVL